MAGNKKKTGEKLRRMEERHNEKDRLTNWYMINLTWGAVAMGVLIYLQNCYKTASIAVHMQLVTWIMTAVFAAAAIVVFALGKTKVIKNYSRAKNYSIFLAVCALASLWLSVYNPIRAFVESIINKFDPLFMINSHWNIWILMLGVGIYLVAAFIYYLIKLYKD